MSSVPNEILRDILQPLDRWTLDTAQFTNKRFLQLIMKRMSDVCLRQIHLASFRGPTEHGTTNGSLYIHVDQPERTLSKVHKDTAHLFGEFVETLRSSRVITLTLNRLVFTPEFAALVLRTPIVADALSLVERSSVELVPAQFREVLLRFSPTALDMNTCHLRGCHISNEFLRELSKNGVRRVTFPVAPPVDGGSFGVTDDAVVDFCVQQDVQAEQRGFGALGPCRELAVHFGGFTKDLFKRLVEASSASMRTQPFRIVASPMHLEEEDLRGFAQYPSYRNRGKWNQLRIYDVTEEQHGTVAAMHTQIVLQPGNRLELICARRPNPLFYETDE